LADGAISRYKRVIGDSLRSRTHRRQVTEAAIAANALNRMLELGRPKSVRIALPALSRRSFPDLAAGDLRLHHGMKLRARLLSQSIAPVRCQCDKCR